MPHQIPPKAPNPQGLAPAESEHTPAGEEASPQSSAADGRTVKVLPEQDVHINIQNGQRLGQTDPVRRPLASRILTRVEDFFKNLLGRSNTSSVSDASLKSIDRSTLWTKLESLPADKATSRQLGIDSAMAQFPYDHSYKDIQTAMDVDVGKLPDGQPGIGNQWTHMTDWDSPELTDFKTALDNNTLFKGRLKIKGSLIHDTKSGLVATMFKDKVNGQVKLVFGGTTAGKNLSFIDGKKLLLRQGAADAANFTGASIPMSYQQAAEMTRLAGEQFGSEKLSLVGHSLGGGLAQYSAAMNQVPANCFSTAALGKAALKKLAKEGKLQPDWLKGNINHVMVKGDPVSNPIGLSLYSKSFAPTNLGSRMVIEGQSWKLSDPVIGRHVKSHQHVSKAVEKHLASPPNKPS